MSFDNHSKPTKGQDRTPPRWILITIAALIFGGIFYWLVAGNNTGLSDSSLRTSSALASPGRPVSAQEPDRVSWQAIVAAVEAGQVEQFIVQGDLITITQSDGSQIRAQKESSISAVEMMRLLGCLLYTSPSPRDGATSRMPSSA